MNSSSMASMPTRKRSKALPVILVLLAAGLFSYWLFTVRGHVSWRAIEKSLLIPLARMLAYLGIGLFTGHLIEYMGWSSKIAVLSRPVTRFARLKDECGAAFSAAFVSNLTANTMLMTYYREGRITRREMSLTYLLNTGVPVFLVHLPTTFFILGSLVREAGFIYLGICFAAAVLKSGLVAVYCRMRLRPDQDPEGRIRPAGDMPVNKKREKSSFFASFKRRFSRVVLYTAPMYVIVFAVNQLGFFKWLQTGLAGWISASILPMESLSVVVVSLAAEFSSGAAAAGALMDSGDLSVQNTVLALVIGAVAATPIRAVRHQLPSQAGIFTPALALKQLAVSQSLRIATIVLISSLYFIFF